MVERARIVPLVAAHLDDDVHGVAQVVEGHHLVEVHEEGVGEAQLVGSGHRHPRLEEPDRVVGEEAHQPAREAEEQVLAAGLFQDVDYPNVPEGKIKIINSPVIFSDNPASIRFAAPELGQHTEDICRDLLKMPEEEIQRLVKEDILHTPASSKGGGTSILG